MAKLPYSRVVNVTLSRNENFPSRRGFGVPLLLTNVAVAGKVDSATRTIVYGSIEEVAVNHNSATPVYAAALAAFSQNPRPLQIKVGYVNVTVGTTTNAQMKTELDTLLAFDADWYWLGIVAAMRDNVAITDAIVEWIEARNKQAIIDSNAIATETANDTTSIAGRKKGLVTRSTVFYHTGAAFYPGFALAATLGTRNFDQANSAYTAKFKKLRGIPAVDKGSAAIQAITGFTPALGQSTTAGNCAMTLVDIGGQIFTVEGSTLTPNVFIDEIHATDWIIARTEEETLSIMLNNDRIPYTDAGMEQLAAGARVVMRQASRAGLIANDINPETGAYEPAIEYTIPGALDVPESQRKARIAPEIAVKFRYAGAVHYTTINYRMAF